LQGDGGGGKEDDKGVERGGREVGGEGRREGGGKELGVWGGGKGRGKMEKRGGEEKG